MHDSVVFLGPSLPVALARPLLDAEFRAPICRGDLDRLPLEVRFVGIIDGEFFQKLAVSPKEVLKAIGRGVEVFGSSSMGALRAAETHMYGMQGVGRVFAMFRDGVLDGDDEVALSYEPSTYRALSDPMVNLREALRLAQAEGLITETNRDQLIKQMKARYFPQRSWRALEEMCPALRQFTRNRELPDLKRDDARELLALMHRAREISHHRQGRLMRERACRGRTV